MATDPKNLPAQISDAIVSIPKGLTPSVVKALDRLLGASVDIPVAWLKQRRVRIDAQTESFRLVEASIASAAASAAGKNTDIEQRALDVLVRKEYRKQVNREAIAAAFVDELQEQNNGADQGDQTTSSDAGLDEDWLNIFERYAEDASSERLQDLWGRVLAGEVRKPGRFSARTLRFLSEFSQSDALIFEQFSKCAFGDHAPKGLVSPNPNADVRDLMRLEASGLIQGGSGLGLRKSLRFNETGAAFLREGGYIVILKGEPGKKVSYEALILTNLAEELLCLVKSRNPAEIAKSVAQHIRCPEINEARVANIPEGADYVSLEDGEVLWR